jgi:hypothetical protein
MTKVAFSAPELLVMKVWTLGSRSESESVFRNRGLPSVAATISEGRKPVHEMEIKDPGITFATGTWFDFPLKRQGTVVPVSDAVVVVEIDMVVVVEIVECVTTRSPSLSI